MLRNLYTSARRFSSIQKRILVAVANGSEELETVAIMDILRRTGVARVDLAKVDTNKNQENALLKTNSLLSEMSRGVLIQADKHIDDLDQSQLNLYDCFVVPGGHTGAETIGANKKVWEIIEDFIMEQKLIGAICAAPMVLHNHKLLKGFGDATCYPAFKSKFDQGTTIWQDQPVVVNKNLITSQGPGTAIEFSLKLVEAMFGPEKAKEVGDPLVLKASKGLFKEY